ncbi:hypothetical protein FUAX_06940 [Fulvitalea axinellae]|uniref:Lipoprotein n=2 Tax=Fulvitalea axinellae TaxID=1182444 RepID=A0AAU9CK39_9BACT|nr:hypothetical protein FUAX_06940 [Fulvitalea axinellae]
MFLGRKTIALTFFVLTTYTGCQLKTKPNQRREITLELNKVKTKAVDTVSKNRFFDFPIPKLDSVLQYYETSGATGYVPSKRFYNPSDSGIFVFYTLFNKQTVRGREYAINEEYQGMLTTHTYWKTGYGWSAMDKDQTFILLQLYGTSIKIGKGIKVGVGIKDLKVELGEPIYQTDSSLVFLGKNNLIGQFEFNKERKLKSIVYGRFNLPSKIFTLDSINRRRIIENKLGSK